MITIIDKQTGAKNSKKFTLGNSGPDFYPHVPVTLYLLGTLGGGEEVKVQFLEPDGATWQDMYIDGSKLVLTATDNVKTVYGPLEFRVVKGTTSAAVGVGMSRVRGVS